MSFNSKLIIGIIFWGLGSAGFSLCGAEAPKSETSASQKAVKNGLFPEELISVDDLHALMKKNKSLVILDARSKKNYQEGHIQKAKLPLTKEFYEKEELFRQGIIKKAPDREKALEAAMAKVPKNSEIVTYCNNDCHASAALLLKLKQMGFKNVRAMEDGFQTWQQRGYPYQSSAS